MGLDDDEFLSQTMNFDVYSLRAAAKKRIKAAERNCIRLRRPGECGWPGWAKCAWCIACEREYWIPLGMTPVFAVHPGRPRFWCTECLDNETSTAEGR